MQKLTTIALIIISAILGLSAASAMAYSSQAGQLMVTPAVGMYNFDHARDLSTGVMTSIAVGYNFSPTIGIEALTGFMRAAGDDNTNNNVNGTYLSLDGLYHFINNTHFEPFVMAGIGALELNPVQGFSANNPLIKEPRSQANVNAGVGVQYHFSRVTSLRADVRDIYSVTQTNNGSNDILANLGVSFALGGAQ